MSTAYTKPYIRPAFNFGPTSPTAAETISPPSHGFPISIAGRNYMADTSFEPYRREAFNHKSLQPQRQSLHFTNLPDDGTVSTEGLWRREARDWSLGSGQIYFDRTGSADNRFAHSKGVDPWVQWQFSLLPDTIAQYSMSGGPSRSIIKAIRCGQYVFHAEATASGSGLYYRTSWSSSTAITGTITGTILDMCSDGYSVYVVTTTGVWIVTPKLSGLTQTQLVLGGDSAGHSGAHSTWLAADTSYDLQAKIAYVGNRLILAFSNLAQWDNAAGTYHPGAALFDLSSHTAGTALSPSAPEWLFTHPNAQWVWSGIAASSTSIYISGYSSTDNGAMSAVYRTGIDQAAAAGSVPNLSSPVVALPMPPGEYPTAIKGYMNYIFLGSNKGIRMCEANSSTSTGGAGELKAGPLIPNVTEEVASPVVGITANNRYIYWTWNNFDDTSCGLGRLDLTQFIDPLAPAYASDLMISSGLYRTIKWLDWDPITDSPLMTAPLSIYTADPDNCVASGTVNSGLITYGIPDNKNAVKMDGNVTNAGDSISSAASFSLLVDDHPSIDLGSYNGNSRKFTLGFNQQFGEQYTITTTLTAGVTYDSSGVSHRVSPTLNRWTLKALPGIPSGIMINVPILMYDNIEVDGQVITYDPYAEYTFLENLRQTQTVVTYVEGTFTALCTVDLIHWLPERRRMVTQGGYHGDLVVSLKTISG